MDAHLWRADQIQLMAAEIRHLEVDFAEHKCEFDEDAGYTPRCKGDAEYRTLLIDGSGFENTFKDAMDDLVFALPDDSRVADPADVYYNIDNRLKGKVIRPCKYRLSAEPALNDNDKWAILHCIERLLEITADCIETYRREGTTQAKLPSMLKAHRRISKMLRTINIRYMDLRSTLWDWRRVAAERTHHPSAKKARREFNVGT
jgi:hypothetical protein